MNREITEKLINAAQTARESSYSPYSNFSVGAALITKTGTIYTGANIESASFTPTVCAERVAFFTAVHKGERNFEAIAIVGGKTGENLTQFCAPCGVCRQVMTEFCDGDFEVILYDGSNSKTFLLSELFPEAFGADLAAVVDRPFGEQKVC